MDADIEKQLIRACIAGDRSAREELLRGHSKRVYAVCLGMLGNAHDAEDCAQEALMRGFTQIHQLRGDGQFGGWIARIARNVCVDLLRKRKRSEETMTVSAPPSQARQHGYSDLYDAIARLPEDYRLPLMLYYFDGRSSESVAMTLGISPAGVLTRLSRARKELRTLLGSREVRHE